MSEFGPAGATGGVWDCPDLFELPVVGGGEGERQWVMEVDLNPGHIAGGSGGQYFVGTFDGTEFVATEGIEETLWLDFGKDFYCATTWSTAPDNEEHRRWIGWMSNWQYASEVPTYPWRGSMTSPREVRLVSTEEGPRLAQNLLPALDELRGDPVTELPALPLGGAYELQVDVTLGDASLVEMVFPQEAAAPYARLFYDVERGVLALERTDVGNAEVAPTFPGLHEAPLSADDGTISLRILVDENRLEVFAQDGRVVITDLMVASGERAPPELLVEGQAEDVSVTAWPLRSSWR